MIVNESFVEGRRGKQVEYCEVDLHLTLEEVADWPIRILPQGILQLNHNVLEPWRKWIELEPGIYKNPLKCTTPEDLAKQYPVPEHFKRDIPTSGIIPYQDGILYFVMAPMNGNILEIGTRWGHSASIIAQTCPSAKILSIEPGDERVLKSREFLAPYTNVTVLHTKSWEYLQTFSGPKLDAIFIDGHHRLVGYDVPWFNWLKEGGRILFHDWSSWGCWHVVKAVELMSRQLKRRPDLEIIDTNQKGMVAFYRRPGEYIHGL